jgi:hypothetical protein
MSRRDDLRNDLNRTIIEAAKLMQSDGMTHAQSFAATLTAVQGVVKMLILSAPADTRASLAEVFAGEIKAAFTTFRGH